MGVGWRYGLNVSQLSDWGRLDQDDRLVLPAANSVMEFAPLLFRSVVRRGALTLWKPRASMG